MQYSTILLSLGALSTALAVPATGNVRGTVVKEIYRFPNVTPIENIALTRHGELLLSTLSLGRIYGIHPDAASPSPRIVAELPGMDAVSGIAEVSPDVFAVSGGKINAAHNAFEQGSSTMFTVDMRGCTDDQAAKVRQIARFPDAGTLNGMAPLPAHPGVALSADSGSGNIYRIDTRTGTVDVAFNDPLLARGNDPSAPQLAVNGIRVAGGHLYFTNTAQGVLGKIQITPVGEKVGAAQVIATVNDAADPKRVFDDFNLLGGNAYACLQPDSLLRISLANDKVAIAAGGKGTGILDDPTSVAIDAKGNRLFVSTQGATRGYTGSVVEVSNL